MMIPMNAICDDRVILVDEFEIRDYPWGGFEMPCGCGACDSIIATRWSWMDEYCEEYA